MSHTLFYLAISPTRRELRKRGGPLTLDEQVPPDVPKKGLDARKRTPPRDNVTLVLCGTFKPFTSISPIRKLNSVLMEVWEGRRGCWWWEGDAHPLIVYHPVSHSQHVLVFEKSNHDASDSTLNIWMPIQSVRRERLPHVVCAGTVAFQ